MAQKPKIQYIGMFYVHGSEAKKLALEEQRREARTKLPLARLQRVERFYVDPVAIAAIVVSVLLLVSMVAGALALQDDWAAYQQMSSYLSDLNAANAQLRQEYREGYDLADIELKATALGMVPRDTLERRTVTVSVPEPEPQINRVDMLKLTLEEMFRP